MDGRFVGSAIQEMNQFIAAWPIWLWVAILLSYCYVASVLPVWVLLQPRDFINSLQLISSLGLVVLGLLVAAVVGPNAVSSHEATPALTMFAPFLDLHPQNARQSFPFFCDNRLWCCKWLSLSCKFRDIEQATQVRD